MRYVHALAVARLWQETGGRPEVELGALEPTLWRDGAIGISDLAGGLVEAGFKVTMTTNGSTLWKHAAALRAAGISLLRISWHTTNPELFQEISGFGDYATYERGICAAARAGLRMAFNRVLLKGYTEDLPNQLELVQRFDLRLKLLDLLWTPAVAAVYRDLYQDWRPIVRRYVLPRTSRVERVNRSGGRQRIRFHLAGGGVVEVKVGDSVNRSVPPCAQCPHRNVCLEEFGDYFRVEPEMNGYFCYLRRDIGFGVAEFLRGGQGAPGALRARLGAMLGTPADGFLRSATLRFILVPFCNFNCALPGSGITWCHKATGNYFFPRRKPTIRASSVATPRSEATLVTA
jgi:cyclic pyranopterin phosphate synthase